MDPDRGEIFVANAAGDSSVRRMPNVTMRTSERVAIRSPIGAYARAMPAAAGEVERKLAR